MIESFLTYLKAELCLAPLTVSAYRCDLVQWERYMRSIDSDGCFAPLDYTSADLRLWVSHLSESGCSPRTVHRKLSALGAFYRYLMRTRSDIKFNPVSDIATPRSGSALPVFIRADEIAELLDSPFDADSFVEVRDRLIMVMLYATGMRSAELISLTDVNVDTKKCELKVHGKRNKDRIIPFGKELAEMIELYRGLRHRDADESADEFFVLESGKPLYRKKLYDIVHTTLSGRVHATRLSPHVLRHSFATDMLNSGADIDAVRALMGHKSLASTQVYTHITYRDLIQNYKSAHPRAQKKGENHGSKS